MVGTVSFVKYHSCKNMPKNVCIVYVHYGHDFFDDEMIEDSWEKMVNGKMKKITYCPYCKINLCKGEN